ncbi:MAG: hypothetical protein V1909_00220 [Candidatus Micrarchaeota archaeon]
MEKNTEKIDWIEQLKEKWQKEAHGSLLTIDGVFNRMFSEIRKGHEAERDKDLEIVSVAANVAEQEIKQLKSELEAAQFEAKCSDKDLEMEKAARTAWENKANELLKQSEADSELLKERKAKIDELWKELESKCKECVDVRLELSAAKSGVKVEKNQVMMHLSGYENMRNDIERLEKENEELKKAIEDGELPNEKEMFEQSRRAGFMEAVEELEKWCKVPHDPPQNVDDWVKSKKEEEKI